MNNDICVVCGEPIPEGTMVCFACLREHNIEPSNKHYFEDDMLIAEFKTKDIALNFLANLYDLTEAEFMIVDESGKIAFRNIINLQYLIDRLEEAEKTYRRPTIPRDDAGTKTFQRSSSR